MKDITIDLYKYFSKFVPAAVLSKSFTQSEASRQAGYSEISVEVVQPSTKRIPEIDTFVVSINESFVSDRVRNSNSFVLFVEYGKISFNPETANGLTEHIAVTVAHPVAEKNTDNLNELLIMNQCFEILAKIVQTLHEEQNEVDFCRNNKLITYPVEFSVVEPSVFYGCAGWTAIFKNEKTVLL